MEQLPSTTYVSPPRQGRGRLNTIMEEKEDNGSQGTRSDSEGEYSDSTIIGRPAGWDPKLFIASAPRKLSRLATSYTATSPVSDASGPSPCSSLGSGVRRNDGRSSYSGSEVGTIFSEDSVPSLASDPTTFATDSSRNSVASNKSNRNRYPALLIPRGSWSSMEIKEISLPMSPGPKINLSPAILSSLPRQAPSENGTPSLGSSSSVAESPSMPSLSGPGTPDMRHLQGVDDEDWTDQAPSHVHNALEITIDEDHSMILSPAEAHGPPSELMPPTPGGFAALISPREREWGGMVGRFPLVPGATPLRTPVEGPTRAMIRCQQTGESEDGVHLPLSALQTLDRLTRQYSPDEKSEASRLDRLREEMRERSEPSMGSRPRSLDGVTPHSEGSFSKLSDYSFTQLSIPSPGGFFSSLQTGARHTWCMQPSRTSSVPSSAVAENFYHNWDALVAGNKMKETVLNVSEDTNATEGPPTARQPVFNNADKTSVPERRNSRSSGEEDMYGATAATAAATAPVGLPNSPPHKFEYEEAYAEEIKQVAEANLDRTSSWLAAQTSYLSALRDNNPINSPADYLPSPHPFLSDEEASVFRTDSMKSNIQKTVRFLESAQAAQLPAGPSAAVKEAITAAATASGVIDPTTTTAASPIQTSPTSSDNSTRGTKDPVFLAAFKHLIHDRKKLDAFLHATSRLQAVRSDRVALPEKHITQLQSSHSITAPTRPKYSGPFNQNPRATGIFDRTADQLKFEAVEKEQRALASVQQASWQVEALKTINGGRLLASNEACQRLTKRATLPLTDPECVGAKRYRILDLGGEATAGWAWHAANKWPNVKVYTAIMKDQATLQTPAGNAKAQGPENHKVVTVQQLWQLPFKANHFDVISARGLHMLLKNNPVPGVPQIDEWDLVTKECMRVLKPGGCLDFMVMDSGIAKAGNKAEKMSVEFGFELHRRGYEREAARGWLKRLRKEGFVGVKRAWMFWPAGRKEEEGSLGEEGGEWREAPRPVSEVSTISKIVKQYMDVEAVQGPVGSTEGIADITGLLGQRMWEEWMVKVRREGGREGSRLLEGIDEVLEECKQEGAGWKVLVGWARKPRAKKPKKEKNEAVEVVELKLEQIQTNTVVNDDGTPVVSPSSESNEMVEMGHIPLMIMG